MYITLRLLRLLVSLAIMLLCGAGIFLSGHAVFMRIQLIPALLAGSVVWVCAWVAVTLVLGRIYCSTVCPLGTFQDCAGAAGRWLRPRFRYRYRRPLSGLRIASLGVCTVLMVSGWGILPTLLDPATAYSRIVMGIFEPLRCQFTRLAFVWSTFAVGTALAVAIGAVAAWRGRILCNTLCPVGTVLGIAAQRAVFHTEINPDLCIDCGLCTDNCKAHCIDLPRRLVDNSRCVVCFDCMAVCPNNAITYRAGRHRLGMPMMQLSGSNSSNIQKQCDNTSNC